MKHDYKKLYDSSIAIKRQVQAQGKSGAWHNARPEPYYSLLERLRQAWDVFRYKADALYWDIDLDK